MLVCIVIRDRNVSLYCDTVHECLFCVVIRYMNVSLCCDTVQEC